MTLHLPIVVDLDGTLIRTDTLAETLAQTVWTKPLSVLMAFLSLFRGRAIFKQNLAKVSRLDFTSLPVRGELVEFLVEEATKGREIHLVTAADQSIAEEALVRFKFLKSATGSSNGLNLKAANKAEYLKKKFPDGFVYAGDSQADLAVWQSSAGVILAGAGRRTTRAAKNLGKPLVGEFSQPRNSIRTWLKALRVHQWAKNLLIFVPLLIAGAYTDVAHIQATVIAFICLGAVASGTYLLNDLIDLSSDRRHRSKKNRPLASGSLPIWSGLLAAPLLVLGGVVASLSVNTELMIAIVCYLVITIAYSIGLKKKVVLDVLVLATLFTIRLIIGTASVEVSASYWLMSFSMLFFLSLSLAKRHIEVSAAPPGARIKGRGYVAEDGPFTLAAGLAAAFAAVVILCLYISDDIGVMDGYNNPIFLWAAPVVIGAWALRIWLFAHRGSLDDDPVVFAVRDKISLGLGGGLMLSFIAANLS